ncbi:hypothetical protein [Bradyrhizobium semiaridum]|nr:hypothetical protein [Bradyrhizobium semiaridum]
MLTVLISSDFAIAITVHAGLMALAHQTPDAKRVKAVIGQVMELLD